MCVRALYQVNSKWQRKVKVKVAIRESVRRVLHNYYHILLYIQINKQQQQKLYIRVYTWPCAIMH